jgi:hypothetical protein
MNMAYEQKDNSGSLFRNERKTTQNHPDFTGSVKVGGVDYWLSAWTKPGKDGKKGFFSLAFTPKDDQQQKPQQNNGDAAAPEFGDLPF